MGKFSSMLVYRLSVCPSGEPAETPLLNVNQLDWIEDIIHRLAQNSFVYSQVDLVGWGRTSYGGIASTNLQKVSVTVIPNTECNRSYPYQISGAQMCTFTALKDACDVSSDLNAAENRRLLLTQLFLFFYFIVLKIPARRWRACILLRSICWPCIFGWCHQFWYGLRIKYATYSLTNIIVSKLDKKHHKRHFQSLCYLSETLKIHIGSIV